MGGGPLLDTVLGIGYTEVKRCGSCPQEAYNLVDRSLSSYVQRSIIRSAEGERMKTQMRELSVQS